MPTNRYTTTLCTGTALIVAGGVGIGVTVLSTVEVMDTETHQWSTAADLPQPIYWASATLYGDQVYMLGGANENGEHTKFVYSCSVSTLIESSVPESPYLEETLKASLEDKDSMIWRKLADLPVKRSTCESFCGQVLVIGGRMDTGEYSTAVHKYDSTTNSWEIISHMTIGRCNCFTAVLPDNRLMAVGGLTVGSGANNTCTYSVELDSMEIASLCLC